MNNITAALVTFTDTGESRSLETRPNSNCHFFERFTIGDHDIVLRLDWNDLDHNGHPTLDADFIDPETGKHRRLKGKLRDAHHTPSLHDHSRSYEWVFDNFRRQFSVSVEWQAIIQETAKFGDTCLAEMNLDRKP